MVCIFFLLFFLCALFLVSLCGLSEGLVCVVSNSFKDLAVSFMVVGSFVSCSSYSMLTVSWSFVSGVQIRGCVVVRFIANFQALASS